MNFKQLIITMFALSATISDEEVKNYLEKMKAQADKANTLEADNADLKAQVEQLTEDLDAATDPKKQPTGNKDLSELKQALQAQGDLINKLNQKLVDKEAEAVVSQMIRDGKIAPAQKETYLNEAKKDPAQMAETAKSMPKLFDPEKGLGIGNGGGNDPEQPLNSTQAAIAHLRAKQEAV